MKTLVEYIKEAAEEKKVPSSKTLSFSFGGFEGAEDILKSAQEIAEKDGVSIEIEDEKIKVTLKKDEFEKGEGLFELLQDYIQLRGKDQKVASDESYAQKIHKLNDLLNDWREYGDDASEDVDDQKEADKKEEEADKKEEE